MFSFSLHYQGWCQIRLATNPDPTDERRGVSGYSFAVAGEPDLDRTIRFQDPVAPRPGVEQQVGVSVRAVTSSEGHMLHDHPLLGAQVELLNEDGHPPCRPRDPRGSRFEERNGVFTAPALEPIYPYHIRFSNREVSLQRDMHFVDSQGHAVPDIVEVEDRELERYGAVRSIPRAEEVMTTTGIRHAKEFRARRKAVLEAARAGLGPEEQTARAALDQRLIELGQHYAEPVDRREVALTAMQLRSFELNGKAHVADPCSRLGSIDRATPWPTWFWFGAWDCDALYAYVKGVLTVPWTAGERS